MDRPRDSTRTMASPSSSTVRPWSRSLLLVKALADLRLRTRTLVNAIYDYQAASEEEFSFSQGDVIAVTDTDVRYLRSLPPFGQG